MATAMRRRRRPFPRRPAGTTSTPTSTTRT
uniref:Uncharacterized protein n=1 Tax=Arundo donax TaxID=35708 RepID=A0A0A9CFX7_ARUDO